MVVLTVLGSVNRFDDCLTKNDSLTFISRIHVHSLQLALVPCNPYSRELSESFAHMPMEQVSGGSLTNLH